MLPRTVAVRVKPSGDRTIRLASFTLIMTAVGST